MLAAPRQQLPSIEEHLRETGITVQRLAVSYAFHSRWIDPAATRCCDMLRNVQWRKPQLPLLCCAQAGALDAVDADSFWRAARRPIRFRDTIAALERRGSFHYIDVGPAGTLATFLKYALPPSSASTVQPLLTPAGQDLKNLQNLSLEALQHTA